MTLLGEKSAIARPFLKWAGGKTQLLDEIDRRLPKREIETGEIDTYVEPFAGGGAVFFHIAQNYPQFEHFLLFDVNEDLINCYEAVKNNADLLIDDLRRLKNRYLRADEAGRKALFYRLRDEFNRDRSPAKLIFLNKTCYNGLYRVNRSNGFNVPFGGYTNPTICDEENLRNASTVLQDAELICADFETAEEYIGSNCFIYLDPPYRPISRTAAFTSYAKEDFSENDQIRLAGFCRRLDKGGAKFLLSNSDPKNEDPRDHFFEDHYNNFGIERVKATRAINCKSTGRGQINEILVRNYL